MRRSSGRRRARRLRLLWVRDHLILSLAKGMGFGLRIKLLSAITWHVLDTFNDHSLETQKSGCKRFFGDHCLSPHLGRRYLALPGLSATNRTILCHRRLTALSRTLLLCRAVSGPMRCHRHGTHSGSLQECTPPYRSLLLVRLSASSGDWRARGHAFC